MPSPFAREGEGEQLLQHVGIPATRSIDVLEILMVHRLTWQDNSEQTNSLAPGARVHGICGYHLRPS